MRILRYLIEFCVYSTFISSMIALVYLLHFLWR